MKQKSFFNKQSRSSHSNSNKSSNSFKKKSSGFRGDKQIKTKNFFGKSRVSIELIVDYLAKNAVLDLNTFLEQLNISGKDQESVLFKIQLLLKNKIIKTENNDTFVFNKGLIPNSEYYQVVLLNILDSVVAEHFICKISALDGTAVKETDVLIYDINKNLMHKRIVARLVLENEKIIAEPLLYLDSNTIAFPKSSASATQESSIKGVYKREEGFDYLIPLSFRSRKDLVLNNAPKDLVEGSIIKARLVKGDRVIPSEADFIEVVALASEVKSSSMMSVYQFDLPYEFTNEVTQEAKDAKACTIDNRRDVRHLPLVTIDDEDAKDFDDAIWAEAIQDGSGAYKCYVAIADVSHYVAINSELDKEALVRGNSVYLPGFVIPMLPKELSNGWCSLNPQEDRGCLLCEMVINRNGEIETFDFSRGLMKSKARLTYKEVQNALDGNISEHIAPIFNEVVKPIYECYKLLDKARERRHTLEIHSQETKIILDNDDNLLSIKIRESLTSHKIVEEFMVSANVAAAKFTAVAGYSPKGLCVYRVHDKPTQEKLVNFLQQLKSFDIPVRDIKISETKINGEFFNSFVKKYSKEYFVVSLNEIILRCQAQAVYDVNNIGHFGLSLKEYSHFTSPIRRYADLMTHRLILHILDKDNNKFDYTRGDVTTIAENISITERKAFSAEMTAKERIITRWLADKIGETFEAYISTITKAGMFIGLKENGASGLIPMRTISTQFADFDSERNMILDRATKKTYKIGQPVQVILTEADTIRGLLTFKLSSSNARSKYAR
jgi:ribonuclease R